MILLFLISNNFKTNLHILSVNCCCWGAIKQQINYFSYTADIKSQPTKLGHLIILNIKK